jgi:large subunit ribosomal protein L7Ae
VTPYEKKPKDDNPLFEKRPKRFGIGQDIPPPTRDLTRLVKWPKYIRLQRQRRVLYQRLKVPPALNQFSRTLDKNTAVEVFKLLVKYKPETPAAKKKRLLEKAAARLAATDARKVARGWNTSKDKPKTEKPPKKEKKEKKEKPKRKKFVKTPKGEEAPKKEAKKEAPKKEKKPKESTKDADSASKKPNVVKYGINHITGLVESKKAQLVVIAHDVDPIEIVVWLPALCRKMQVPYVIVKGKARLGAIVGKKTATAVAITTVANEDKDVLKRVLEAIKTNYTDKYEEVRRHWGGGKLGLKSQQRQIKKAALRKKEHAKSADSRPTPLAVVAAPPAQPAEEKAQ